MPSILRRTALLVTAAITAVLFIAAPAGAQTAPYPGEGGIYTPTPRPVVSSQVEIIGYGCSPGDSVTITVNPTYTAIADENGEFRVTITAPATPGPATVTAQCGDSTFSLELDVIAVSSSGLARTGTDSLPLVRVALVLFAVGALIVLATRRRSRESAPAASS